MSEADKMFIELGYYYKDFDNMIHVYRKEGDLYEISFLIEEKEVSKSYYSEVGNITMQELQAINQKCKELGWI